MEEDGETAPILHSTSSNLTLQDSGHYDSPQNTAVAENNSQIKVYRWRWVVLAIFVAVISVNNGVWIAFASIADVVQCYYNTSKFWVNSASMVYMLTYTLFIVPSAWLLGRVGLRTALVIAAAANAAGSCLRVAGAGPTAGSFWVMLSGQTIASLSNLLLWGTPSYLAGVWFPASERGTAAAIVGALAPQLGAVCSYIVGPLLVHSDDTNTVCGGNATVDPDLHNEWTNTIYYQMIYYSSGLAGISLLLFFLSLIAVPNAPPTPPSRSQLLAESSNQDNSFANTLKAILTNHYFILLLVTASINLGAAGAIVSLFNEIIHPFFKNRDKDVVYIGITALVPGMITVFIVGPILSATKAFYAMNVGLYITAFLSIGGFLAALQFFGNFYVLYPFVAIVGSSVTGFQAVVYEYAAEMTYPLQEGISGGLVNWVSQPMAILMIVAGAKFVNVNGHQVPVAWTIAGLVLIGAIITIFIKPELRKTNIDKQKNQLHVARLPKVAT